MRISFMPIAVKVSGIKEKEGEKNGKTWKRTSFFGSRVEHGKNGGFETKKLFESWNDISIAEGGHYIIEGYSEDTKNSEGKFETRFTATNAIPLEVEEAYEETEDNDDIPF